MEININIDRLTDCLIERATGKLVLTEYRIREKNLRPKDYKGWKFNWSKTIENNYTVYELFVKGDDVVQGRVALKLIKGAVDIDIVENAPHNLGHNGKYEGVGGHLFAIACQVSIENGREGFVSFTAKTALIKYYEKNVGAKVISGQRMYIDERAANVLLDKYIRS